MYLPEQVGELRPGAHPVHQGQVPLVDLRPVDAGHVLDPEVLALQPPRLAEHLPPFGVGPHRHLDPLQVHPAADPAGVVALGQLLGRLDHTQPPLRPVQQGAAVGGDREVGDAGGQLLALVGGQLVGGQHPVAGRFGGRPVDVAGTGDRVRGEQHPVDRPGHPVVPAQRHRYRDHPPLDPLQVDVDTLHSGRLHLVHSGQWRDLRHERGRLVGAQGHRVQPVGEREAVLQVLHPVRYRVVLPLPDEVQVPSLRVERRPPVAPHRRDHLVGLPGLHPGQPDPGGLRAVRPGVGDPTPVRRPRRILDAAEPAVVQPGQRGLVAAQVGQQQFVAVVGQRDDRPGGGGGQLHDPAGVQVGQAPRRCGTVRVEQHQRLAVAVVAGRGDQPAAGQMRQQSVPDAVRLAVLPHRTRPVAEAEGLAPGGDRQARAVGGQADGVEVPVGGHELPAALRP